MATKIKGIYTKGFKYIAQIFVVKEREMDIGYPTDVKHVAHIGWDGGASNNTPSWMDEFKANSEYSSTSGLIINTRDSNSPWSSHQDFEECGTGHKTSHSFSGVTAPSDLPKVPKKQKRKKKKSSSPTSSSSSSRTSRGLKFKTRHQEREPTPTLEV